MTGNAPRWELLRALGAVAGHPADAQAACGALGLAAPGNAEHTEVFVLNCPPYAAVYLGDGGGLGGDAADRVAGFWRAIGVAPPAEPDHLTALLSLYANLGEAAAGARTAAAGEALARARHALFLEHLWSWLPAYLEAVAALGATAPALAAWAALAGRAIAAERAGHPGGQLPLALRAAPDPLSPDCAPRDLSAALTAPVRSGLILTRRRLAAGAAEIGAGHRIGERRFALDAMLTQARGGTLRWLADEAGCWAGQHAARAHDGTTSAGRDAVQDWWAGRARHTEAVLRTIAAATDAEDEAPLSRQAAGQRPAG
ncbi:MAG TPA: molecular chaperone TorD family protein [Trebonia sp.]|nr:molecular chaperone TorD family protein [Trebonia sp.]